MYVVLGRRCQRIAQLVSEDLLKRGGKVFLTSGRLSELEQLTFCFGGDGSRARFVPLKLTGRKIEGVFVCINANEIRKADHSEKPDWVRQEIAAALLAWINAARCQVANRYSAILWYVPNLPIVFWSDLLKKAKLLPVNSIVTNIPADIRRFAARTLRKFTYAPLGVGSKYPIASPSNWQDIQRLRQIAPVHLTESTAVARRVCVVGSKCFISESDIALTDRLKSRLLCFSALAKLPFIEFEVHFEKREARVASIEAFPKLGWFDNATQLDIASAIVDLLIQ
jgi:hypothetical protein